tara:strand:- start:930 stop:1157 length:228 start_codon:yes stop_codon:yes gene_type:complete
MLYEIIGWTATSLILIGYYLNAKKYISSWTLWFLGNLLMMIYSIGIGANPQIVLAFILMVLNIYGYIKWKKDNSF